MAALFPLVEFSNTQLSKSVQIRKSLLWSFEPFKFNANPAAHQKLHIATSHQPNQLLFAGMIFAASPLQFFYTP